MKKKVWQLSLYQFIYMYKSFGEVLYFNPEDLTLPEMEKGFDALNKLSKSNNIEIFDLASQLNSIFGNKFLYNLSNNQYIPLSKEKVI